MGIFKNPSTMGDNFWMLGWQVLSPFGFLTQNFIYFLHISEKQAGGGRMIFPRKYTPLNNP